MPHNSFQQQKQFSQTNINLGFKLFYKNLNLNETKPHKTYVSVPEAARLSGLSEYFIRSGAKKGDIPHQVCGNKFFINYPRMMQILAETEM